MESQTQLQDRLLLAFCLLFTYLNPPPDVVRRIGLLDVDSIHQDACFNPPGIHWRFDLEPGPMVGERPLQIPTNQVSLNPSI